MEPETSLYRVGFQLKSVLRAGRLLWSFHGENPSPPAPLGVAWEITYRCDSRCGSCSAFEYADRLAPLSAMDVRRAAANIGRAGVTHVTLSGGEPLLYPHLFEAIEVLTGHGVAVHLSTNGSRLAELAPALVRARVRSVTVGLSGLDRQEHDQSHGYDGLYDAMAAGVEKFRVAAAGRALTRLRFLVTGRNFADMPAVAAQWKGLVDEICFQPVQRLFCGHVHRPGDAGLLFAPEQRADFRRTVQELTARYPVFGSDYYRLMERAIFDSAGLRNEFTCLVPAFFFKVLPNGDVVSCADHVSVLGNLLDRSLTEIWRHPDLLALRRRCRRRTRDCFCWVQPIQVSFLLPEWAERILKLRSALSLKKLV